MVMDKLSNNLKNVLKKIAGAPIIDEQLINELVKDIQRALLSADTNVKLVLQLTKNIKKRALEKEAPKGTNSRDYLVNIVYEELTNFLGGKNEPIVIKKNKPFKIMLVGLFGNGKCVHEKSKIPLSTGEILEIKEIYQKFNKLPKEQLKDGEAIDIKSENIYVPSFNPDTLKIENKKVTNIWKLKKEELIEVNLDNGNDFSIKVTPEHPFFVMRNGELTQLRSDQLNETDHIAIPNKYNTINQKQINLFNEIKKLDLDIHAGNEEKNILLKNKQIKEIHKKLKNKRNYSALTNKIKNNIIPIECLNKYEKPNMKIKLISSHKPIHFPTYLTKDLAEFTGYLIGDGHLNNKGIEISNEDQEIINRIIELSQSLFGITPKLQKDERTKSLYNIRIHSTTLKTIFNKIFNIPIGKKGRNLKIPSQILNSSNNVLKQLIKSYFDCDAHPVKNSRVIELTSESKNLIDQTHTALLRFGIISTISKKTINETEYYRLFIRARYAEQYINKIGFLVSNKNNTSKKYKSMGILQGCGKQDMIPLSKNLKEMREFLGFSIGEIQSKGVSSYGNYESHGKISRESLLKTINIYENNKIGIISKFLENITELNSHFNISQINAISSHLENLGIISNKNQIISITNDGQKFISKTQEKSNIHLLNFSKNLSESDICWTKVKQIKQIKNDSNFVYDLTVEDNHSFIADNIIVHNTTTTAKLAKYYAKRSYKVAILSLDVHRPAAMKQTEQLGKQINIQTFTNETEKDPIKIYKEIEPKLKQYDIVLIDTAGRDALSEELIKEIENLNKKIKPDEKLLVLSADMGQTAEKQAEQFHKSCGITGIIATKMDGTAKAGGALSAAATTNAKIKFLTTGETENDLEEFNPEGFVGRLLGMGDLKALLEKTKHAISEEKAQDLGKRFLKGEFNFLDMYEQMAAMNKMGSLSKLMEMVPGMGQMKIPKDALKTQEGKLEKWKIIMQSMTKEELENPDILTRSRLDRIAKGSGTKTGEVRELLKQYRQTKKMSKMMKGDPNKMMKKFKGKIPGM